MVDAQRQYENKLIKMSNKIRLACVHDENPDISLF